MIALRSLSTLAVLAIAGPALAVPLAPSALTIDVPMGTNNPGGAGTNLTPDPALVYVDDVYVHALEFGAARFLGDTNFRGANGVQVLSGRSNINVEWGDADTGSDGDASPMARIGEPDSRQELTDPAVQDRALLEVFSGNSLTEMSDGESRPFTYKVSFANGITDNDAAVDDIPEIVFYERGRNDVFTISLIIGGTFEFPVLSDPLEIRSADFFDTGLRVNTQEISRAQVLGVAGFDLNDWGIAAGTTAFGYLLDGSGADFAGVFASGETEQFTDPIPKASALPALTPVPLPAGVWLLGGALGAAGWASARKRRRG